MISVTQALSDLFALVKPLETETVPLALANGRVLATPLQARRDQPPFAASAMDGYGISDTAPPAQGRQFTLIGEAAAGHRFDGQVGPGEMVRIFTGAPVPQGVQRVILQEDCTADGPTITISGQPGDGANIRPAGGDFVTGQGIEPGRRLAPADIALLAAMNHADIPVIRKPIVALISTGDELVMPGEPPSPDQIIASNTFGLKALFENAGAHARLLPIARDNRASLETVFGLVDDADLIVTIGGASVGDHDLVGDVAADLGLDRVFYKVAMRPGKPLMAGRMGNAAMIGLPGNPVSAMICGHLFALPVIDAMLGLGAQPRARLQAVLDTDLPANSTREHYMRARVARGHIAPFERQDSSLLTILSEANALLVRPPNDGPRQAGELVDYVPL